MKIGIYYKVVTTFVLVPFAGAYSFAQNNSTQANLLGQNLAKNVNVVTTAVPFLVITPDARGGGMGDAGVATSPDANSMAYNIAKLGFIDNDMGFDVSYTPWLRQLVPDINLGYLSFYKKLDQHQVISFALRYFSLGNIQFTDNGGVNIGSFNPEEYSLDVGYALKLSDNWSVGMTGRYLYSNLTGGAASGGQYTEPGHGVGVDIGTYYKSNELEWGGKKTYVSAGLSISNIGNKISYTNSGDADFQPTLLRLGPSITMNLDEYNKITWALDLTKLLVPTPPVYELDSGGNQVLKDGQPVILAGENPDVSVPAGMIQSFYDAPGGGLEELHEIDYATGFEYWYDNQFAARAGFFYENPTKGGREFMTFGVGLRLKVLNVDLSYLIPITQQNPLQNTLQITLGFNFDKSKKTGTDKAADSQAAPAN
jgi:hypothetical protein